MFPVGHNLCFEWAMENNVEKNDIIFRAGISCLKWQEGRGLQKAFLEAWIIFYFQNTDVLGLSAKCQPTCWRERQEFGTNIMISMHPSPASTPQMTTGNSWAKVSALIPTEGRVTWLLSVPAFHFLWTTRCPPFYWLAAPSSNAPLALPEHKTLHPYVLSADFHRQGRLLMLQHHMTMWKEQTSQ